MRRLLRRMGWLLAIVVLVFALAELWLATTGPAPPVDKTPLVRVAPHPVLGYALVPMQETFSYHAGVRTDASGLRVVPTATTGPKALFLGGSETFGKGVAAGQTFAARIGAARGWQVVNAGVPDYNIDQSLLWLERYGVRRAPDVVVLTVYYDDLYEEPGLDKNAAPVDEWAPRHVAKRRGWLEIVAPLYTRSRVLYTLRNFAKTTIGRWRGYREPTWREAIIKDRRLPELESAWARVDLAFERLAAFAKRHDVDPVVLVLPIEHTIEEDPQPFFVTNVRRRAERHRLHVVDATDALRAAPEPPYIPWDGRPSAAGHAAIAEAFRGFRNDI